VCLDISYTIREDEDDGQLYLRVNMEFWSGVANNRTTAVIVDCCVANVLQEGSGGGLDYETNGNHGFHLTLDKKWDMVTTYVNGDGDNQFIQAGKQTSTLYRQTCSINTSLSNMYTYQNPVLDSRTFLLRGSVTFRTAKK
jgi:hypothetical protein